MVKDEADLVITRLNRAAADQALLTQLAIGSMLSKEAGKAFNDAVSRLAET